MLSFERCNCQEYITDYLSRNARRKAEAFDWSVVLPQWEQLFEEILSHA